MEHVIAKIIKIKKYGNKYCMVSLENRFSGQPAPGQFLHVKIEGVFLRRPFSFAGADAKNVSILFQVKGKGTQLLSEKTPGETLDLLGPAGNHFPFKKFPGKILVAAGGLGIAPMLFLAASLVRGNREFTFFYGAKNKAELLDFLIPGGEYPVFISTDDGSSGKKGNVPAMIEKNIKQNKFSVIFGSGPYLMLKQLALISTKTGIPAYLSLENRMFCGTGVCQGCVIETVHGFKKVCSDGPVFKSDEISWTNKPPV